MRGGQKNRLIREPHDQLVARLRETVAGTCQVSKQRLPELLEMVLAGDQGMREIANAIGELHVQAALEKGNRKKVRQSIVSGVTHGSLVPLLGKAVADEG